VVIPVKGLTMKPLGRKAAQKISTRQTALPQKNLIKDCPILLQFG